jgi:hypothetical protein
VTKPAPQPAQPGAPRVGPAAGIPQPPHPAPRPGSRDPLDLDAAAEGERSTSRRARRASVPSWDDIVFGSRRD